MPWSYPTNVPSFAKNKSEESQKLAVKVANEILSKTSDEDSAIFAAIAAVKKLESQTKASKSTQVAFKRSTPSHIPTLVQKAVEEPVEASQEQPKIRKEFLGKNALPVETDRNLVSVELTDTFLLVHTFDTGEQIRTDLSKIQGTVENFVHITNEQKTGGTGTLNSATLSVNTVADTPLIVSHNLGLLDPEAILVSSFLNGRLVDLDLEILDGNSVEIVTFVDTVDLKLNFVGI